MTDDEAFIRAIVASPGDDLPRLVYADYLDERGDPRGTYLRGELDRGKESKLTQLALELDAVWVARVSRPPLGVCCDHLTFTGSGRPLTGADIDHATDQLGVALPVQLRAFLLNHNGGVPSKAAFLPKWLTAQEPVETLRGDPLSYWEVGHFFGIARSFVEDLLDAAESLRPRGLPTELVPTAVIPDTESLVLIVAGWHGGRVYLWGDVEGEPYNPEALSLQSESLADFLRNLSDLPQ